MPSRQHRFLHTFLSALMLLQSLFLALPIYGSNGSWEEGSNNPEALPRIQVGAEKENESDSAAIWELRARQFTETQLAFEEPSPVNLGEPLAPGTLLHKNDFLHYRQFLPLVSLQTNGRNELTILPDEWVAETENWTIHELGYFSIRSPQNYTLVVNPLLETTASLYLSGFQGAISFAIEEKASSNATNDQVPADVKKHIQNGDIISDALVKGLPAWDIKPLAVHNQFCRKIVVSEANYWIRFQQEKGESDSCDSDTLIIILSSLQIRMMSDEPSPPISDDPGQTTYGPNAITWINYNRTAAYNYAATYGLVQNNDDGYYVPSGGDGAHYLAHFLQAGGFPIHYNAGQNNSSPTVVNTATQRNYVLGFSDVNSTSSGNLQRGDVIYISNGSYFCWGMAVVNMRSGVPYISTHSIETFDVRYDLYYCGTAANHWYEFEHIDATADHPANPQLSSSLSINPSSQIINQSVASSFSVTNYGGQSVSLNLRVTTNGGGDFATQSCTLAAGASCTYSRSRTFSSAGTWPNTCAQMQVGGGSWQNIPANGRTVCRTLTIVPPGTSDVRLANNLSISPNEIPQPGGTIQSSFQVRNYSNYTQIERFRARVTNGSVTFAETGDVTLSPNGTYNYNQSRNFSQPGVYEVIAEHLVNGNWVALVGNGSGFIRVLEPPPPPIKEEKGNPPSSGNAGEPVNTATGNYYYLYSDLSDPTPGLSMQVTRWYNALDAADVQGPFGYGTSWEYGTFIEWRPDKSAIVHMGDGHQVYYLGSVDPDNPSDMSGNYVSQSKDVAFLERLADGTGILTFVNQTAYIFDANGRLQRIVSPYPAELAFSYDGSNRLVQVTHSAGFTYTVVYSGNLITALSSSNGRSVSYTYTPAGDLATVTRPEGLFHIYTYDSNHRLTEGRDPNNNVFVQNVYDAQGRVERQYDQTGQESFFNYDSGSLTQTYIDALGNTLTHSYDADYNLVAETNALGYTKIYTRNVNGWVTAMRDARGQVWQYTYDSQGNLLTETDPLSNIWSYAYDANNNRIAQMNPHGDTWLYEYDINNRLTLVTDPVGNTREYAYDAQGNLVWERNEVGAITQYGYNELGLQTVITDALRHTTHMEYDAYGNQTRYIDANGNEAIFFYDAANRLVESIDPMGAVITFTYDAMGNLLTQSDGMGNLKTYTYDAHDRVISDTDFNGNTTQYGYDGLGRLTVVTDTLGSVTRYTFDAVGNLTALQDKDGSITTYLYDQAGNLLRETDTLGRETHYLYDAAGRLTETRRPCDSCSNGYAATTQVYDAAGQVIQETDSRGAITLFFYDDVGRLAISQDPLNNVTAYTYDPLGRLIQELTPDGALSRYAYDLLGQPITTTNSLGYQTINAYDAVGNLSQVVNGRGYTTTYTYDANDRLVTTVDALGNTTSNTYDAAGNLLTTTNPLGHTTSFTYDANGNQTSVIDARGYTSSIAYDDLNRPTERIDPLGYSSRTGYDVMGRVISETNALGFTSVYTYDVVGRRVAERSPLGHITTYNYDSADNQITRTDANGAIWQYEYDANGNQVRQTNPLGHVWQTEYDLLNRTTANIDPLSAIARSEYDAAGNLVRATDPRGAVTEYTYDALGQLVQETDALGYTTFYTYDGAGNHLTLQDGRGFVTSHVYDALNRQIAQYDPLGQVRYTVYDAASQVLAEVDYNGQATAYTYDAVGNQVQVTDALSNTITNTYDALNRVVAVTDALGNTQTREYDALGQVITSTTTAGHTTLYIYDPEGRQIARTNPLGDTWATTYDAVGRPIQQTDALGRVETTVYDALGQVITETDALNRNTAFVYDPLGRLLAVIGPDGTTQQYTYDPVGNLLTEQDGNGHTTRYQYDLLNQLKRKIDPLGRMWSYQYDGNGNQTALYTPSYNLLSQTYDELNRLTGKTVNNELALQLAYDANGNRTTMTDTIGVTIYQYDVLNRLIASTDPHGRTVQYNYDALGRQTTLTYPDGASASYTYDTDGELASVTAPDGAVTSYTRDALGRPTLVTQGNSVTIATSYDAVGNVLSIVQRDAVGAIFAQHDYTIDDADRRIQLTETLPQGSFTTAYTYDSLDRLTDSTSTDGRETHYVFDGAGNRLAMSGIRKSDNGLESYTITYSYNAANQLIQADDSILGVTEYSYDADGNRVGQTSAGERHSYSYDAKSHLIEAHVEQWQGTEWSYKDGIYEGYAYDGDGRRVSKATFSAGTGNLITEKVYRYDDVSQWHVLQTFDAENARFLYDEYLHKLAYWQGDTAGYLQNDGLGSFLGGTNINGNLTNPDSLMRYDDYGEELESESVLPTEDGYTGYEVDGYTGLDYARSRYYDATSGSFITSDPYPANYQTIGNIHRYLYVQANPINYVDPLGLFRWISPSSGIIESGDTLWGIAASYWRVSPTSVNWGMITAIQRSNPWIKNPNLIFAGNILYLPNPLSAYQHFNNSNLGAISSGTNGSYCGNPNPGSSPPPYGNPPPSNSTPPRDGSGCSNCNHQTNPEVIDKTKNDPNLRLLFDIANTLLGAGRSGSVSRTLIKLPPDPGQLKLPLPQALSVVTKKDVLPYLEVKLYAEISRPSVVLNQKKYELISGSAGGSIELGVTFPVYGIVRAGVSGGIKAQVAGSVDIVWLSKSKAIMEPNFTPVVEGYITGKIYVGFQASTGYVDATGEIGVKATATGDIFRRKAELSIGPYAQASFNASRWVNWEVNWEGPRLKKGFSW